MSEPDTLERRLRATTCWHELVRVTSCPSTQDLAKALPGRTSTIVWADAQTAGRGRKGRSWHGSPGEDVEVTFRACGPVLADPTLVAAAAPTAFAQALEHASGERILLDWPNDLMCRGRKLCGVLIDVVGNPPDTWLVGVGANVNRTRFPPELRERATSLALSTGRRFDRADLVLRLAQALDRAFEELARGEPDRLAGEFAARLGLVGRRVRVAGPSFEQNDRLVAVDLVNARLASGRVVPLGQLYRLEPG